MPDNTVYVGRPGKYGNPFRIGGYFAFGDPFPERAGPFKMAYYEGPADDPRCTLIANAEQAVEWYRRLMKVLPPRPAFLEALRGKDLACWCRVGSPCHADVLLELVNPSEAA